MRLKTNHQRDDLGELGRKGTPPLLTGGVPMVATSERVNR